MRLFVLAVSLALVASTACASTRDHIPEERTAAGFDFRPYVEEGFLFTTDEVYDGPYESLGFFVFEYSPEAQRVQRTTQQGRTTTDWHVEEFDPQAILEFAHETARDMGADAIIRFDYDFSVRSESVGAGESVSIPEVRISGLAINREGSP